MIRVKCLLSCFIGTLVYILVSMTFGQNGCASYKKLEEQKINISMRASQIQLINDELQLEKSALQNDKDLIASYARKMDYVSDNEKLVKINGLKPYQNTIYDTGTVLRRQNFVYLPESYCKLIGLIFIALSFIVFLVIDISRGEIIIQKKKETYIQGIPVYDLPQV